MIKHLILIFFLLTCLCKSQCPTDLPRKGFYDYFEVYNNSTEQYEKFRFASSTSMSITINTDQREITLKDKINNYDKRFEILQCILLDTAMVYRCIDLGNKQYCDMIFNSTEYYYQMMVIYIPEPIIYRVKRRK